jgi:hypothetical protein
VNERFKLVNCTNCGTKEVTAFKRWRILPSKKEPVESEHRQQGGVYQCAKCKTKFKSTTNVEEKSSQPTFSGSAERIEEIRLGLIQTLNNLRINIEALETEKPTLLFEIEDRKKNAESRVIELELEVSQLREELKTFKDLLGFSEETA